MHQIVFNYIFLINISINFIFQKVTPKLCPILKKIVISVLGNYLKKLLFSVLLMDKIKIISFYLDHLKQGIIYFIFKNNSIIEIRQ